MLKDVSRRVLVIAPAGTPEAALREVIAEEPEPVEPRIVSPASDLSFVQWLANAEDDARAEAEETAQRAAKALAGDAAVVEAGVGDTDPVVAAQDALQSFAADELVVVLPDGEGGARPPGSNVRPCPASSGWEYRCDTCGRAARRSDLDG